MRTAINVVVILLLGLGIGIMLRATRPDAPLEEAPHVSEADPTRPAGIDDQTLSRVAPGPEKAEGWLDDFQLTERSGEAWTRSKLAGKPYVASFFFSTCPSICKLQNEKLQQLQTAFAGQGVRFVAISVDPEVDTPEVLREYAKRYSADPEQWLFFTGEMSHIRRVGAEMFEVAVNKKFHTEKFILVNPAGDVVGYYTWTDESQFSRLKKDIAQLVAAGEGAS